MPDSAATRNRDEDDEVDGDLLLPREGNRHTRSSTRKITASSSPRKVPYSKYTPPPKQQSEDPPRSNTLPRRQQQRQPHTYLRKSTSKSLERKQRAAPTKST